MIPDYTAVAAAYPTQIFELFGDAVPTLDLDAEDDGSMPAVLRNWLVRLRLLEGVPFANLVADTELLPPESIRWFYLDRRWTDAAVQGALSVGTVNSDDRIQLEANYPAARAELDSEERNLRLGVDVGRRSGSAGPISGFLLRSEAVSGWPGLHVRAFAQDTFDDDEPIMNVDAPRVQLLRLERLAPAVLLCLFDGVPQLVHIEEPRQGIQFGFDVTETNDTMAFDLQVRDAKTFEYLSGGDRVPVGFRPNASGVVDIQALERELSAFPDALASIPEPVTTDEDEAANAVMDSAEYALQLVQFPWRQVWGEVDEPPIVNVFRPTISHAALVASVQPGDVS